MTDLNCNRLVGQKKNRYFLLALLAVTGVSFTCFDIGSLEPARRVFAEDSTKKREASASKRKSKGKKASKDKSVEVKQQEPLFLQENDKTATFLPEIYRCPECGYEQDEEGMCPDHTAMALVKVLSSGRDPLAPSELDGNEDIIVDIPLKNIEFNKEAVTAPATDTDKL